MSTGAIIGIIIAVIIVAAVVVVASAQLRRARMRRQFGPEYDRLAKEIGPRKADAELAARQRRVEALDIRPLLGRAAGQVQRRLDRDPGAVRRHPAEAVTAAGTLIWDVMRDRGYPVNDRNASHGGAVRPPRPLPRGLPAGPGLCRTESASTEQLRGALIHYRALFEDLAGLQEGPGQSSRERTAGSATARVPWPEMTASSATTTAASRRTAKHCDQRPRT